MRRRKALLAHGQAIAPFRVLTRGPTAGDDRIANGTHDTGTGRRMCFDRSEEKAVCRRRGDVHAVRKLLLPPSGWNAYGRLATEGERPERRRRDGLIIDVELDANRRRSNHERGRAVEVRKLDADRVAEEITPDRLADRSIRWKCTAASTRILRRSSPGREPTVGGKDGGDWRAAEPK